MFTLPENMANINTIAKASEPPSCLSCDLDSVDSLKSVAEFAGKSTQMIYVFANV